MKTPDGKGWCRKAREYYYDLLNPDDAAIPETIRRHIERCAFCREQVRHLGELLAERPGVDGAPSGGNETIETLSLHFQHLDAQVTCAQIRPLLAGLLSLSRGIRIPTPVTVHLDHCPACAEDLAALRALDLRADQLRRLSRFYGVATNRTEAVCRRDQAAVTALASFAPEDLDAETLDHLSVCPRCRTEIYRHRERLANAGCAPAAGPQGLTCREVSMADLFDRVLPWGSRSTAGAAGEGHGGAAVRHVRTCSKCVEKAQILHRTIYGIAERADSKIATVYHVQDDDGAGGKDAFGPRYPVSVEILHHVGTPSAAAEHSPSTAGPVTKAPAAGPRRRPFTRIITVAAAIVVVTVLFQPTVPTASGTNIGEILQALERAPNIYMASFSRDSTRPYQEAWSARGPGLFATRGSRGCTLYDCDRRKKRTSDPEFGNDAPVTMTRQECQWARCMMASYVWSALENAAQGTELHPAADGDDDAAGESRVYEMIWTGQGHGSSTRLHRWKIWLDPATRLPRRIESSTKRLADDAWTQAQTYLFEYPTEADIRGHIRALFPK